MCSRESRLDRRDYAVRLVEARCRRQSGGCRQLTRVSLDALRLDPERATQEIVDGLRAAVLGEMRRRGAVVALSGGVDSSVCIALCARAFEPERVLALLMPEAESASDTLELGRLVADHYGVETVLEDISGLLDGRVRRRRDDAIRRVLPEYGPGWRAKIVLPSLLSGDRMRVFSVVAEPRRARAGRFA